MFRKKLLTALSLVLVLCTLVSIGALGLQALAAETLGSISGGHSQTHTAGDSLAAIQQQNAEWAVRQFLDQCATPLDGSNGTPDLCIPGLSSTDNMIPQGMTYYKAKNWVLIASYKNGGGSPSVIYALSLETGRFVAQFNLYNNDKSACTAHVGGIAASNFNLYIADKNNSISYVPLSELNVAEGTLKDIYIQGTVDLAELSSANTSFCSFDNGILWTGNFYHTADGYNTPANSVYNSMIFGYALQGANSQTEWNAFATGSITGDASASSNADCAGYPSHTLAVPNTITKIQCALVAKGRVYMGTSYGRKNACDLYIADIDLTKKGNTTVTIAGHQTDAYLLSDYRTFNNHLYMNEGMFMLNNEIYILTESAAFKYYGESPTNKCTYPTDVIWKLDPYALMGEVAPDDSGITSYYSKVYNWDEIGVDDEYIIVFKSSAVENGNNVLYALDANGGYAGNPLPKYTVRANAGQGATGDSMGMIGKKLSNYTFTNGDKKLVLNNPDDDDVESMRWSIEKTGDGNAVRITSKDSYFANAPFLYYGSRLVYMTLGGNEQFANVYLAPTGSSDGSFQLYYKGSKEYYMFCNDGTISDGLDSYSRYYAENDVKERDADKSTTRNEDHTGTVYYGQTEQAGTFHMDGTYSRSCDYHSGNKIGYHPNKESSSNKVLGTAVGNSYTYFYIYRRIIQTEGSQGKSNLFTGKKAYAAADGTYTIDLQAYATGSTQSAISDKGVPLDVVLVVDRSASMTSEDCLNYDKVYRVSYDTYRRRPGDDKDREAYYKLGDTYYLIQRGSYDTYAYNSHSGSMGRDSVKNAGTTWYYLFDGEYCQINYKYYRKNNSAAYSYSTAVLYIEHNGNYYALYNTGTDCNCSNKGTDAHEAAHLIGTSMPSNKNGYDDFRNSANAYYNCYKKDSSNPNYKGTYYTYDKTTHYYLYFEANGKTYYLDGLNITEDRPDQYTSTSEYIYTGAYYTKTNVQRRTAVAKAAREFVADLRVDSGKYNIDHRIAFVEFGNDASSATPLLGNYNWQHTGVWNKTDSSGSGQFILKNNLDAAAEKTVYKNAFNSANDATADYAISEMAGGTTFTCAAPNHGMEMAYEILSNSSAKAEYAAGTRKAVVVMISDGVPGNPERSDNPNIAKIYANGAIEQAAKIKALGHCDIYTIYIGTESMSGFNVDDYMEGVSSNYPNATGYPGYNNKVLGEKNPDGNYYSKITTGGDLSKLLEQISYEAIASGTAVKLNSTAVLKDVLSDSFAFPSDLSQLKVTLQTQELSYNAANKLVEGAIVNNPAGVTYEIVGNEINVTGFDYTTNYVAPDHPGKRLIVKLEGILPTRDIVGYDIDTNDNERSGIYAHPDVSVPMENLTKDEVTRLLPAPETSVPEHNYIFDFGSVMPITDNSGELLAVSNSPAKLSATAYPLETSNTAGASAKIDTAANGLDLTMGMTNSYIYAFIKTGHDSYEWTRVNLIPASNVYFEETSLTPVTGTGTAWASTAAASAAAQSPSGNYDLYGFDASYNFNDGKLFSGNAALKTTVNSGSKTSDKVKFTFTGESFDLISACGPQTGVLAVKVTNSATGATKYYVVDTYYTDANYLVDGLARQVPVMTFSGDCGTYNVEVSGVYLNSAGAVKNSGAKAAPSALSAVDRSVLNALAELGYDDVSASEVEKIWMDDSSVLNDKVPVAYSAPAKAPAAKANETAADVSLDVYIDAVRIYKPYGNNDPASYIAGEKNARYINVLGNLKSGGMTGSNDGKIAYVEGGSYDSLEFADYNNYQFGGPHNEVYLNKVTDGAVTGLSFTLGNFDKTKSQVMLSLRYVQKNGAANGSECKINNAIIRISSATEMYYDITEYVNDDGTVTIQNLGDNLLAVGYIKLADAKVSVDDSALAKAQRAMAQPGVETDVLARFIPVAENDAEEADNVKRPLGAEIITVNGANNDNDGIVFDFLDTVLGSVSAMFKKIASFLANIFGFFR